ncbi:D-allulose-6-phosphate 3-epimerase [Anaerosphaera aminiphila DSM 21120]|uniref:Putative D-allulose-6-phosphate 3-epimerase n=1 Tax=Anaerosphaera aminiphila DSM 21120 TaxID=1120995 RepID=A0A1M5TRY3_9FIRM|nr:D-allulose 6-phosphate 3-epimerase [Anaerosphaera aminiphila]SHH53484.1 D-allulose-6-phosphate 3-epimerase [Anaerosphaera aminiphila DSM 21120]
MKAKFSPSLMCMDLLNIREQIEIINERADFYHVDIMDGHYVKNITLSPDFVKAVKPVCKLPIDCHLMVTNPEDFVEMLAEAGADYICPHAETINAQAFRIINKIKSLGVKVGVVLNPATPLSYIKHYIHLLDKITIMTVDPGFAGQSFIEEMLEKIEEARDIKEKNGYKYLIEVDGSCNEKTFKRLNDAGCEVFIVGSSGLFGLDSDLTVAWDKMIENFKRETE